MLSSVQKQKLLCCLNGEFYHRLLALLCLAWVYVLIVCF